MSPGRAFHKYSESQLKDAIAAVREGETIRAACRKFGVPRGTVQDRLHGRVQDGPRRMGPETCLSASEESQLVDWCLKLHETGFLFKPDYLLNTVEQMVIDNKKETRFKNGRPGRKWYHSFLKRHPEIIEYKSQPKSLSSKEKSSNAEESKRKWFNDLKRYLQDNHYCDILNDTSRVFNLDEATFVLCPKNETVLGPKGFKLGDIQQANLKKIISVSLIISANGDVLPPCVVFPFVRLPKSIIKSVPDGWFAEKSDTGSTKAKILSNYIETLVQNWLNSHNVKRPILMFADGSKTQLTMQLSKFCSDNGIILYNLPPPSAQMIKPTEFSILKPLKSKWSTTMAQWRLLPGNANAFLTKYSFCSLLQIVLNNNNLYNLINHGFKQCGICPFNMEVNSAADGLQEILEPNHNIEYRNVERMEEDIEQEHGHEQEPEPEPSHEQNPQNQQQFYNNSATDELNITINYLKRLNDADPNFHLAMTLNYLSNISNSNVNRNHVIIPNNQQFVIINNNPIQTATVSSLNTIPTNYQYLQ